MANYKIIKIVTLLMAVAPRLALSDGNLRHISRMAETTVRELLDERDPVDDDDCLSLGALDIVFRTHNYGPPDVGVILTDPRGRRIGFDPLTKKAWQALPVAQGYIDCDDLDGRHACRGVVQVCGPVSGTYKLEMIAQKTTAYSLNISARGKEALGGDGLQCSHSTADVNDVAIRARSRNIILLNYSRDPEANVMAQFQHMSHAPSFDSRSHSPANAKPKQDSVAGQ